MFINSDGKLFGKVSVVDIIVVIAVIVIAVGVGMKFISPAAKIVTEKQKIEYVMKIRDIRMYTVEALQKKGSVIDAKTREAMGEITAVEYKNAVQEDMMTDGTFGAFELPDKYDAFITVSVDGKVNETGYYTNQNKALTMGSSTKVATKYSVTSGEIVKIYEVK